MKFNIWSRSSFGRRLIDGVFELIRLIKGIKILSFEVKSLL